MATLGVLFFGVAERPDFIALNAARLHGPHRLVVDCEASFPRFAEQLRNSVDFHQVFHRWIAWKLAGVSPSSPVAILATRIAAPITSAGRFSLFGPLGILFPLLSSGALAV